MGLRLSDLLKYDDIVIQCHDNPDADAIASGFAVYSYLRKMGKLSRLIYGGSFSIQKSNLCLMVARLDIPVEHVTELEKPQLLITVDCQYGESNVTRFEAETIAIIDHHQISGTLPELSMVRSNYGSCSTVVWELLQQEKMDINKDVNLATALYYGLYTDTMSLSEISYPADKDLRDYARFSNTDILLFRNSNLSIEELKIAGDALKGALLFPPHRFGLVEAMPCDPNVLGIISDMLLEVDQVDTCVVYNVLPFGVKISVRSCIKEVRASELAAYLADGLGGGGGHTVKAGGFLKKELLQKQGISLEPEVVREFLLNKMRHYYDTTEILHAGFYEGGTEDMKEYRKIPTHVGYVVAKELSPVGSSIMIRTLEGDVDVRVRANTYILIGIEGEIYPLDKAKFEKGYSYSEEEYSFPGEYAPTVQNLSSGDTIHILPFARSCISNGGATILAKELDHRVKVFTAWDRDKYYLGNPGDFLAARLDDPQDIYIIEKNIFYKTYAPVE